MADAIQRLKGLPGKFTPTQSGFLWGLLAPIALLALILRTLRIAERDIGMEPLLVLDLYKSDLLLFGGLGLLGLTLLGATRRLAASLTLGALNVVLLLVAASEVVAHFFFMSTGSTLDFRVASYAVAQFDDTAWVLMSELPLAFFLLAVGAVAVVLAGPWVVRRLFRRRELARDPETAETPSPLRMGTMLVAGVILLSSAWFLPSRTSNTAFARSSTLNLALPGLFEDTINVGEVEAADYGADSVRLVPRDKDSPKTGAKTGDKRNLVFLILESTRARSVTPYNKDIQTTPYLDELADESLMVDRAYAMVPHTSKALVPIHCGIAPRLTMEITETNPDAIPAECLPSLLEKQGYRTAFFQSAKGVFEDRAKLVDNMGFRDFTPLEEMDARGFEQANYFGPEDNVMLQPSREWLRTHGDQPFMITYLTLTPHHQYLAPRRYGRKDFAEDAKLNRYLNAVHYLDHFTRKLIEQYKELGLYEDTLFVILGDHGEAFREHGRTQHDNVIWEEGLRVPLFIHDPKQPDLAGKRVTAPITQTDLMPTVTDMLGFEVEGAEYPGRHILKADSDRPIHAQCWYERRCMARIVGDEKYIYHYGRRGEEFFDLGEDPLEQNNLAAQRDDLADWKKELMRWQTRINTTYEEYESNKLERYVRHDPPTPANPLEVRFGDHAKLIGFDISRRRLQPGDQVRITYYFETLEGFPTGWKFFNHADGEGDDWTNMDHTPVMGMYAPEKWQPGEFVIDTHTMSVPEDWSSRRLSLLLGFYKPGKGRAPVSNNGSGVTIEDRAAHIVELPVDTTAAERNEEIDRDRLEPYVSRTAPTPQHELDVTFEDMVRLVGYDTSSDHLVRGDTVEITYYFEALRDVPAGWKLFVHGDTGNKTLNYDHVPARGLYPVDRWQKGEYIKDTHQIDLQGSPTDRLDIFLGLWLPGQGRASVAGDVEIDEDRAKVVSFPVKSGE